MKRLSKDDYAERRNERAQARAERRCARKKRREDSPERQIQFFIGLYSLEHDAWGVPFSVHLELFPRALDDGNLRESLVRFYACFNVAIHFKSDQTALAIQKSIVDALMVKAEEALGKTTREDYIFSHYIYAICGCGEKFEIWNARGNMFSRYDNERILSNEFLEFKEFEKYASKNQLPLASWDDTSNNF